MVAIPTEQLGFYQDKIQRQEKMIEDLMQQVKSLQMQQQQFKLDDCPRQRPVSADLLEAKERTDQVYSNGNAQSIARTRLLPQRSSSVSLLDSRFTNPNGASLLSAQLLGL